MSTKVVQVGKVPGTVQTIAVDNGYNVAQICETAELDPAGYEVRINGRVSELAALVADGDTILLTEKIKGN